MSSREFSKGSDKNNSNSFYHKNIILKSKIECLKTRLQVAVLIVNILTFTLLATLSIGVILLVSS